MLRGLGDPIPPAHGRTVGVVARLASSRWEKSSCTGLGLPFMNSSSARWYRSMSSSTSSRAVI
jgi:hypothetical protein